MSTPIADPTYGVAGTSPLRDITNLPYLLLQNHIIANWVQAMAYGIALTDFEFGTQPNLSNNKNIIVRLEPASAPYNEDFDLAEKFTGEIHFVDVIILVRADPNMPNTMPSKLIDMYRYMKKILKQNKTRVTDIENIQLIGDAPTDRDPVSEWYGWTITVGLQVYMVTTVN